MVKNYLKIALRSLKRNPGYAAINVLGLATGIAVCVLILLYVRFETSYDEFHEKADRIYRITHKTKTATLNALGPAMEAEFPEVQQSVRFTNWDDWELKVTRGSTSFYEKNIFFAESSFFKVFDFTVLHGDAEAALAQPFTIALTREMAEKYFGHSDAVGEVLTIQTYFGQHEYEVGAVTENPPSNSHLTFNILASFQTLHTIYPTPEAFTSWNSGGLYTYVLLNTPADITSVKKKFTNFLLKHKKFRNPDKVAPMIMEHHRFQPITDIHLHSRLTGEIKPSGSINYLYIFSALAALVLLIACINYTNLATARASQREREVGVRKTLGASRFQLMRQFLGESLLFTLLAVGLAIGLVKGSLPVFNSLTGQALALHLTDADIIAVILAIGVLTGLLAGSYPAFVLSGCRPSAVLTRRFHRGLSSLLMRKGLVVFQFAISIGLIAGTILIQQQLNFMQSKDLGFTEDHVVVLNARDGLDDSYEAFKQELLRDSRIGKVAGTSARLPAVEMSRPAMEPRETAGDTSDYLVRRIRVDPDFTETLNIPLIRGRDLSGDFHAEEVLPVLVNKTAVETFGWKDPIGKTFDGVNPTPRVVGVVDDFHYRPLDLPVEPLVMMKNWSAPRHVMVRIQPDDVSGAITHIRQQWEKFGPSTALDYTFLDREFDQAYRSQQQLATIFGGFSGLGIFIACLGLLGLAALAAERRTKEIGVRKVVGASVYQIVSLLSKDFLKLVGVAILIATPIAYLAAQRWLEQFAYRIEVGITTFVIAGIVAVVIALLTISYQSIKAALTNPADSLRYE